MTHNDKEHILSARVIL